VLLISDGEKMWTKMKYLVT